MGDLGGAFECKLVELCEVVDDVGVLSGDMVLDEVVKEDVHWRL